MLGKLLVTLGGLLVALLFAALLAPLFVDWTNFRTDFELQASRVFGKKVTVNGKVEARILPFPSVTMNDVRVGQDVDGTPIVQIARFSMDAELAPFLSGEARIFDMRIEKPKARIRLLPDGRLDWMRGATPSVPAKSVVLENVQITDGSIEFIDQQSGRVRQLSGLNAEMSAHSLAGPWRMEGTGAVDGEKGSFTISTAEMDDKAPGLGLHVRLVPDAHPVDVDLDGKVTLEGARPIYKGNFSATLTGGDRKTPQPRTKGTFELTNERVRIPDYRLEIGSTDAPYTISGEATLDVGAKPEFLLKAEGQQVDVNDLGANGASAKTGRQPESSLERRLHALISVAASIPVPQVDGRATLRLPAVVLGDTTLRDIQLDVRPAGTGWTVDKAVAVLPGRTQVEASGRLRLVGEPSFAGNLLVASSQPTGLANWLNGAVDPAVREISKAGFSAAVSLSTDLQRFERLEVVLGNSHLTGRMERQALKGQVPSISADLKGELLDLDEARAFAGLLGSGDFLANHEIAAKLNVDRFTADGIDAQNLDALVTRSNGVIDVERLAVANVAGASLMMSGKPQTGAFRATLTAADPSGIFRILEERMPAHPLLAMLVRNAEYYHKLDLTLEAANTDKTTDVKLKGTANGSRIGAEMQFDLADGLALLTGGTPRFKLDATLEGTDASVVLGQAGFATLPLEGDGGGLLALTVNSDGKKAPATSLSFSSDTTRFNLDGNFSVDAENFAAGKGRFKLESSDVEPYLTMNGVALPQTGGSLPAALSGDVDITMDRVAVTGLEGKVAGNGLTGSLSALRNQAFPKIEGNLTLDSLGLSWLGEAMYGAVVDPVSGDLPETALGKPLAGDADIALTLSASRFDSGVMGPISDLKTSLSYRSGTLEFSDAEGNWLGGKLSHGRLTLANGGDSGIFRVGFDLAGGNAEALSWRRDNMAMMAGRFDLTLSAESTGANLAALRSGLGGSGLARFTNLSVDGLNLDVMGPLVTAADLMRGEITAEKINPILQTLVTNGRTDLGAVEVPFQIADGEARVQSVMVKTDKGQIAASGRLRLDGDAVNASLELGFEPGDFAEAGATPGARLNFSGPLKGPALSVDGTDSANFLSMRAYERERRRVERTQSNVMEKQRLRREGGLYRFNAEQREAAAARAKAEAAAAEKARADAAAAEKARAEEAARKAEEAAKPPLDFTQMPVSPQEKVIQKPLPPINANP